MGAPGGIAKQRVVVVGSQGRMGRRTIAALSGTEDLVVVGTVSRGESLAAKLGDVQPDVAIDFTSPEAVARNAAEILRAGVRPVIGTTGLSLEARAELVDLSRQLKIGGLIAPNFSIGAVLMIEIAAWLARHYEAAEIVEYHHPGKKDAPSGTSLATRERIGSTRMGLPGSSQSPAPIHSVRLAGYLARQEVHFGALGERVSIAHEATDRECYMPGVLLACRRVCELNEVVVGLETLLQ